MDVTDTPAPEVVANSYPMGKRVPMDNGAGDVTALDYKQPVARDIEPDAAGTEWGAALVRVCRHVQSGPVSDDPWMMIYADGGQIEPSSSNSPAFPQPGFPWAEDRTVLAGRCVKGWITFSVPKGKRPQFVEYTNLNLNPPVLFDWPIK